MDPEDYSSYPYSYYYNRDDEIEYDEYDDEIEYDDDDSDKVEQDEDVSEDIVDNAPYDEVFFNDSTCIIQIKYHRNVERTVAIYVSDDSEVSEPYDYVLKNDNEDVLLDKISCVILQNRHHSLVVLEFFDYNDSTSHRDVEIDFDLSGRSTDFVKGIIFSEFNNFWRSWFSKEEAKERKNLNKEKDSYDRWRDIDYKDKDLESILKIMASGATGEYKDIFQNIIKGLDDGQEVW